MRGDNTVGEGLVMPNMTQSEVNAYLAKQNVKEYAVMEVGRKLSGEEKESELHRNILAACKIRGWIAFHARMDKPCTSTLGSPDFVVIAEGGRVFFIESKTAKGKLSTDQLAMKAWANKLGTEIHVIRSMEEFYEITKL